MGRPETMAGLSFTQLFSEQVVFAVAIDHPLAHATGRTMTLGPAAAIWIISKGVVAQDIEAGRMVTLPIDTSTMAGPVGILARSEEDPTPTIRLFLQSILEARKSAESR